MSGVKRGVLFCADDLGVSAGANTGIERAVRAGVVGQASLCVTGAAADEGAESGRRLGIGIGLHLTFSLGHALTGPIAGLTGDDGRFLTLPQVLRNCLLRRVEPQSVRREVDAQFARLRQLVPDPTHVNGHHHVHVFPGIREAAFAAAAANGIRWIRMPDERAATGARWSARRWLLGRLSARARPAARAHGLSWLPFVGLACVGRRDFPARFRAMAGRLPAGDCEWMVHPRHPDAVTAELDPAAADPIAAAAETDLLADAALPAWLGELGVQVLRRFPAAAARDPS